jgi:hypothetical protein
VVRRTGVIASSAALALVALVALAFAGAALSRPARHAAVAKVTVTFTDRSLHASPTTPGSGITTFIVVNRGKKAHALMVKGPGVKGMQSAKVAAGKTARLTVTLHPGAYVLSDPIGLGEYNVLFLDVIKSTSLTAKGDGSVTAPPAELPAMCGMNYTP